MQRPTPPMIDVHAEGVNTGMDLLALEHLDDEQLDDLRFGVIGLDVHGTILKYNLAEARLARLDRSRVLGKSFFKQIAPCTATPDFEGRFRRFIAGTEPRIAFPFTFDFKFGAQEVEVEIVRARSSDRYFLCINRLKFRPPRPAFAAVQAPRQAELVPGEHALGIRRDDAEQRVVVVPETAWRALRLTWDRVAPQGWSLFASEWGLRWGRLAVIDVETELMEKTDRRLADLPLDEALALLRAHVENDGWGTLDIDVTSPAAVTRGAAIIKFERSAIAEASGASEAPRCQLISGLVRAMLGHIAQRPLAVREVRCAAQGAPRCEMIAVAQTRRAQLEAAAATGTDLRGVLAQLDATTTTSNRAGDVLARLF